MDTYRLTLFQSAAYYGSFSKAAEMCNVTQVTMSRQIKHLEDEIGTPLFIRTSKGVELSSAGQILLDASQGYLEQTHRIIHTCKNCEDLPFPVIKILTGAYEWPYIINLMKAFKKQYPSSEYRISCQTYKLIISRLLDDQVDIAIGGENIAQKVGCAYKELIKEKWYVAANKSSLYWKLTNQQKGVLFHQNVITLINNEYDPTMNYCKRCMLPVNNFIETNFLDSIIFYLLTDEGVALLPKSLCSTLPKEIKYEDCLSNTLEESFGIIYNDKKYNPGVKCFVEMSDKHFIN